jgi:transposase, IS30 family
VGQNWTLTMGQFCTLIHKRGFNENTNGLIRDFYPKKTDFRSCSDGDIQKLQNILNNRPRKKLGFMTITQKMVQMIQANDIS